MGPLSLAEARSRAYGLLGRLLLEGLTDKTLPRLRQTPLGARLPEGVDLDEVAAAHHQLLSMDIPPYASSFLTTDPAGCIDEIRDACQAAGFHVDTASARPDHLGIGLLMLSFLCGAQADALGDEQADIAAQTAGLAQAFLTRWLLPWLPPLRAAVAAHDPDGLWGAVVEMAAELAGDHTEAPGEFALPPAPALLSESRTDLKAIASFLLTPCHSGVYLSRADIGRLSRGVSVPRGFGSRQMEMTNLLRTAAEYDELASLMARLDALIAQRGAAMRGAHAGVWQARVSESRVVVQTIRDVVIQGDEG